MPLDEKVATCCQSEIISGKDLMTKSNSYMSSASTSSQSTSKTTDELLYAPVRHRLSNESKEVHRVTFAEERNEYLTSSDQEDQSTTRLISEEDPRDRTYKHPGLEAGSQLGPSKPSIIKQPRSTRSDAHAYKENPFTADGELRKKADFILQYSTISRARIRISDPDRIDPKSSTKKEQTQPGSSLPGDACHNIAYPNDVQSGTMDSQMMIPGVQSQPGADVIKSPTRLKQPVVGRVQPMALKQAENQGQPESTVNNFQLNQNSQSESACLLTSKRVTDTSHDPQLLPLVPTSLGETESWNQSDDKNDENLRDKEKELLRHGEDSDREEINKQRTKKCTCCNIQ